VPLLPLPTSEGKTTRKIRWFPPGHISCFKDHWTRRRCCHGGTSWARPQSHRLNRLLICLWGPHPLRQVPALFVALLGNYIHKNALNRRTSCNLGMIKNWFAFQGCICHPGEHPSKVHQKKLGGHQSPAAPGNLTLHMHLGKVARYPLTSA